MKSKVRFNPQSSKAMDKGFSPNCDEELSEINKIKNKTIASLTFSELKELINHEQAS